MYCSGVNAINSHISTFASNVQERRTPGKFELSEVHLGSDSGK